MLWNLEQKTILKLHIKLLSVIVIIRGVYLFVIRHFITCSNTFRNTVIFVWYCSVKCHFMQSDATLFICLMQVRIFHFKWDITINMALISYDKTDALKSKESSIFTLQHRQLIEKNIFCGLCNFRNNKIFTFTRGSKVVWDSDWHHYRMKQV